ncbi:MAG: hypothetical protein WCO96_02260 [Actinomycetes bacterium]
MRDLTEDSPKAGDSSLQRRAEEWVIKAYNRERPPTKQIEKPKDRTTLSEAAKVDVDAVSHDRSAVYEIYVRQGNLKPGHRRKIAMDALKLVALSGQFRRRVLLFADPLIEAELVKDTTWLAHALREAGIEVECVELSRRQRKQILDAQERQRR